MESSPPERLFSWFHTPRGYATLLTVAAVLVGVGLVRESGAGLGGLGLVGWFLLVGVAFMLLLGVLGMVAPDRLGIEPKETWRVVLMIVVNVVLVLPLLFSL